MALKSGDPILPASLVFKLIKFQPFVKVPIFQLNSSVSGLPALPISTWFDDSNKETSDTKYQNVQFVDLENYKLKKNKN